MHIQLFTLLLAALPYYTHAATSVHTTVSATLSSAIATGKTTTHSKTRHPAFSSAIPVGTAIDNSDYGDHVVECFTSCPRYHSDGIDSQLSLSSPLVQVVCSSFLEWGLYYEASSGDVN
jgi:hypothetical protein